MNPTVSIIIPAYNSEKYIHFTLKSVINQDYKDFEVWVIGDCCKDNTEAVVNSFNDPRINFYNLPKNFGTQSGPNNEGLKRAKGKYIAYINHDDLWLPWHLGKLVEYLESSGDDFVHANVLTITPTYIYIMGEPCEGLSYGNYMVCPSGWLHKKEVAHSIGNWRDHRVVSKHIDRDFMNRAYEAKFKISASKEPSVLKFAALHWSIYDKNKVIFPQEEYLQKLLSDPVDTQLNLLKWSANEYSKLISKNNFSILTLKEYIKLSLYRPFMRFFVRPLRNFYLMNLILVKIQLFFRKRRSKITGEAQHKKFLIHD